MCIRDRCSHFIGFARIESDAGLGQLVPFVFPWRRDANELCPHQKIFCGCLCRRVTCSNWSQYRVKPEPGELCQRLGVSEWLWSVGRTDLAAALMNEQPHMYTYTHTLVLKAALLDKNRVQTHNTTAAMSASWNLPADRPRASYKPPGNGQIPPTMGEIER